MVCVYCGGDIIGSGFPGICGTRDSFGIGKEFKDPHTGKIVDNWRTHEKLGYRNPLESSTISRDYKKLIKKKQKLIKEGNPLNRSVQFADL